MFNFKTRFFNMIQPDYSDPNNPKIKKWAIDKDFYYLIQEEYDWYQKFHLLSFFRILRHKYN